jgi:hypothetical protein
MSMVKRLIALVAMLLFIVPAVSTTQAASPAAKVPAPTIAGTLTSLSSSGTQLTVTTAQNVAYTVNTSSTTKFVRLYNGVSAFDELSPGDAVLVWGPSAGTNTINATVIKDQSIQMGFTRMVGVIGGVSGSVVTATVLADQYAMRAPFGIGQQISLNIGATTKLISPTVGGPVSVMTGTAALSTLAASVGSHFTVLGAYNRLQKAFTTVYRIRLLKPAGSAQSGGSAKKIIIFGILKAVGATTAPTTLSLQTIKYGVITVTVSATPTVAVVRRFDGKSALDELTPGDNVAVFGAFADSSNTTFTAITIKDVSIQEGWTRAVLQVSAQGFNTSASSFTGVVLRDADSLHSPFDEGATVTVVVGSATKIMVPATAPATGVVSGTSSNIQANQTVTVLGVYNRKTHTYISTVFVRIHP